MKPKTHVPKLKGYSKAVLQGMFTAINAYIKKEKKISNKQHKILT